MYVTLIYKILIRNTEGFTPIRGHRCRWGYNAGRYF